MSYTAAPSWIDAAHLQRQRAMGFGHQPTWEKIQLLFRWLFFPSSFLLFFLSLFFSWFIWAYFFFSLGGTCADISNIAVLQKRGKKPPCCLFPAKGCKSRGCHHGMSKAEQSPPGEKAKISRQHCKFQRPPMNTAQWCSLIHSHVSPVQCRESSFFCFSGVSKMANREPRII